MADKIELTNRQSVPLITALTGNELVTLVVGNDMYVVATSTIINSLSKIVTWADIAGKPAEFPPSAHTHVIADVNGLQAALNDKANESSLGELAFIDRITVSEIEAIGDPSSVTFLRGDGQWQTIDLSVFAPINRLITAGDGLEGGGSLTSDITISLNNDTIASLALANTAVQPAALNVKANLASPTFTGVPKAPTASIGDNTTQLATTEFVTRSLAKGCAIIKESGNFTVPNGVYSLDVQLWGGGGGGGGNNVSGQSAGGGGGGGYCRRTLSVTPGQVFEAVIGAGGSAGPAGSNGGNGGTTTFYGSFAFGGSGGSKNPQGNGGAGGSAAAPNAFIIKGADGMRGDATSYGIYGGSGGSAAFIGMETPRSYYDGFSGYGPGSGGSGGGGAAASFTGGAGAAGMIIILY